jgi:hypothetical protein
LPLEDQKINLDDGQPEPSPRGQIDSSTKPVQGSVLKNFFNPATKKHDGVGLNEGLMSNENLEQTDPQTVKAIVDELDDLMNTNNSIDTANTGYM